MENPCAHADVMVEGDNDHFQLVGAVDECRAVLAALEPPIDDFNEGLSRALARGMALQALVSGPQAPTNSRRFLREGCHRRGLS